MLPPKPFTVVRGAVVWVEEEPGIGKSSLVAEALTATSHPGWDIEWGMADQLTKRLPLRVMLDCLQVRPGSPDPRRARAADLLRSRRPGLFAGGDASVSGVEVLVTLVDELCAAAPTVIVVDDLQWADEASLVVWQQLAAAIGQSRLLLIGTCRPVPRRHQVQQLRAAVVRRGGAVVTLGPLPETDVAALVTAMVGAPPADGLRALTAQAAGNPLYVRELVDALVREQALQISPIAEITRTGEQLSAAGRPGGGWAHAWLIQAAPTLTTRAPQLAAELLRRELEETPADKEAWNALVAGLVRALLAAGSYAEAARQARRALEVMTDPARRGQTSWMLARAQVSAGDNDDAMATIRQALAPNGVPGEWRARMLALLAMLERAGAVDLDAVDATARQALAIAGELGDAFAAAHALADLWLTHGVRRDHAGALDYLDRALRVLGDDPSYADLRSFVLDVRVFTLQNLDRWPDAELALRQAREFAQRTGSPDSATWATAAVLRYWLGQWDDVLAELGFDDTGTDAYLRERWPALLSHGVAALIAGRRDQRTAAAEQLRQGLVLPIQTLPDRENQDFLVAAHALALEQDGRPTRP